ncbi:MAG TPA: hypothetical protein PKA63_03990 [Oligoflexia bacterium]|nr:hypothetical protein [Oligoflexia bacterium]HMP47812.1 hypothetical protein [Oligoflexia bacterium]
MTDNEIITTLDFDSLLCKLSKDEDLSPEEVNALERCITANIKGPREKRNLEDLYAALTVVSKSKLQHLSYLAEMCLDVPDPLLVCLALETLAIEWHIGSNYEERLIQFALGVPSDHDGDIRECALRCLGVLLNEGNLDLTKKENLTQTELRLISILVSVLEESATDEPFWSTALGILEETLGEKNKSEHNLADQLLAKVKKIIHKSPPKSGKTTTAGESNITQESTSRPGSMSSSGGLR